MDTTPQVDYNEKGYDLFTITVENGVADIIISNPPVNVLSGRLMMELQSLLKALALDTTVKVIVFSSANPEFFIAHVDINILEEKEILEALGATALEGLNIFQTMGELLRRQPQLTIVKLKGIARGGGAEFAAAADMCFASLEKGKLGQVEALMGIIPGGGATQYLSERMPRGRVLEIVLGAGLFDAKTAERYGWINRALPDGKIDEFVNVLAHQVAALPNGVLEAVKEVLQPAGHTAGFNAEDAAWAKLVSLPKTGQLMNGLMHKGGQTIEGELDIENILRSL